MSDRTVRRFRGGADSQPGPGELPPSGRYGIAGLTRRLLQRLPVPAGILDRESVLVDLGAERLLDGQVRHDEAVVVDLGATGRSALLFRHDRRPRQPRAIDHYEAVVVDQLARIERRVVPLRRIAHGKHIVVLAAGRLRRRILGEALRRLRRRTRSDFLIAAPELVPDHVGSRRRHGTAHLFAVIDDLLAYAVE
ncbi:MAG: hypothetical protein ACLR76_03505 [Alistipes sp.]